MKPVLIIAVFGIIAILISSGTLIVLPSASGLSVVSDTGGNIQGQYIVKSGDNVHIAWGHDTGNPDTVYYAYGTNAGISFSSPIIADYERENPLFKEAVKITITPIISSLSLMENATSESEVLSMGLSVIMLNLVMYLGVPAFGIIKVIQLRKN